MLQGRALADVVAEFDGQTGYGDFKAIVAEEVRQFLIQFQQKLSAVDESAVVAMLERSEQALTITANETLLCAQQAVGLRKGN